MRSLYLLNFYDSPFKFYQQPVLFVMLWLDFSQLLPKFCKSKENLVTMYCNFGSKAVRVRAPRIQLQRCMVISRISRRRRRKEDLIKVLPVLNQIISLQYLDLTRSSLLLLVENQLNCVYYRLKCVARVFCFCFQFGVFAISQSCLQN